MTNQEVLVRNYCNPEVTRLSHKQVDLLERRVALLEGKPDPGLPCNNGDCRGGSVRVWDGDYDKWSWGTCPVCAGTRRTEGPK